MVSQHAIAEVARIFRSQLEVSDPLTVARRGKAADEFRSAAILRRCSRVVTDDSQHKIGSGSIVTVSQNQLRNAIAQFDGLVSPPQTDQVSGV